MRKPARRLFVVCQLAVWSLPAARPAGAEVTEITGSSSATVIQFSGPFPVQSDFGQSIVPLTTPQPPAVSDARLDRLDDNGDTTAAAEALAIFELPDLLGLGPPNDAGLDLAAFADDDFTNWFVEGKVEETRTIVLGPADAATEGFLGGADRTESTVSLSGALIVTASDAAQDLSGLEAIFELKITKRQSGVLPVILVEGELSLAGGPGGSVSIRRATGVFEGLPIGIVDFSDTIQGLALVQAVLFAGLQFPYEYEFIPNQPFELDLSVAARVRTIAGRTGAAAVFGLPQNGLNAIFQRVKKDDRGEQLQQAISQQVDTTGASYANGSGSAPLFFPFCGALGIETMGVLLTGVWFCLISISARRRPRRRPSGA